MPLNKLFFGLCLAFLALGGRASATTYTTIGNGDWGSSTIWSPNGTPALYDDVVIEPGQFVASGVSRQIQNLTLSSGASLLFPGVSGSIAVHNTLSVQVGSVINIGDCYFQVTATPISFGGGGSLEIISTSSIYGTDFVPQSESLASGQSLILDGGVINQGPQFSGDGTLGLTGNAVLHTASLSCRLSLASGSAVVVSGTSGLIFNPYFLSCDPASTVYFSPSGTASFGTTIGSFGGLRFSSGTMDATGPFSVSGNISQGGTSPGFLNLGGQTLTFSGPSFSVIMDSASSQGTVLFSGTADQDLGWAAATSVFDKLQSNKSAGTITLQGGIQVGGNLSLGTGSSSLNFNGQSLEFLGNNFDTGLSAIWGSGSILFDGPGSTLNCGSNEACVFPDFSVNSSGELLFGGTLRVGGNFSLIGSSVLDGGGNDAVFSGSSVQLGSGHFSAVHTAFFSGGLAQSLDVGSFPGTTLINLTVSKSGGALSLQNHDLTLSSSLDVLSGALSLNGRTLTVFKGLSNTGSPSLGAGTVVLAGNSQSIGGSFGFSTLSKTSSIGVTLSFQAGLTQTVSGQLDLYGGPGAGNMFLRSTVPGTRFYINATGSNNLQNLDIQDSYALVPIDVRGKGCVDSGNNVNWIFVDSPTPTPTSSITRTSTPSASPTATPSITQTSTPSVSPSATPSITQTGTPSVSPTETPSITQTDTPSVSPSATPSITQTNTPSASPTATPSISPTGTFTASMTGSPTASVTLSSSPTITQTATPSPDFSPTLSPVPATPVPAFHSSSLGRSVFAPVPVARGGMLCVYFKAAPMSGRCDLYNVAAEKVASVSLSGSQLCIDSSRLAAGIYFARLKVTTLAGREEWIQKLAVIP